MSLPLLQNQPLCNRKGQYPEEGIKIEIVASFVISLKIFLTQCYLHCKVQGETDIIYQDEKNILTFVILAAW